MRNLKDAVEIAASGTAVTYAMARHSLPIAYVLEQNGFPVTEQSEGRVVAICPFHEDHKPSLSVFGTEIERFSCWTCKAQGDVVDLVCKFEPELLGEDGKHTGALFKRIGQLINDLVDSSWSGPSGVNGGKEFDALAASELVIASQQDPNYALIEQFLDYKREQRGEEAWPYSASWLVDERRVGTYGRWVIIPYYSADGELFAYKRWTAPEKPRKSVAGTGIYNGRLYGEDIEDTGLPILLTEGESDAWYAQYLVGEEYRVLSLPTGVNSSTSPAQEMANRTVYLAFDGDGDESRGGRMATYAWAAALEKAGAHVKIIPIPEGKDLSTAGDIRILLSQARSPAKAPVGILETLDGYAVSAKDGERQISNFVFHPVRGLHGEYGSAYEGILKPGGDKAVIRPEDLQSDNRLKVWAAQYGRSWWGNSTQASMLLGLLQSKETFLPSGKMVNVAGLHGNTIVWPKGAIGPEPIVYVPPTSDIGIGEKLSIYKAPWSTEFVHLMRSVQADEAVDPMLAWLAACALRPRMEQKQFPFMMVTGPHGSGKSETTKALLAGFSGSRIVCTFQSTPHTVKMQFAASNLFGQLLDEYRQGTRKDTKERVASLLRDNYTMEASQSGGGGGLWSTIETITPSSPTIIAGEDMFEEGSHVERMIQIPISSREGNYDAFKKLQRSLVRNGFPYAYLEWIQQRIATGEIPDVIRVEPAGPEDLPDRERHNLGVLAFGWSLLQEFMSEHNDNLGEPKFDRVIEHLRELNKNTPIEKALAWCMSEPEAGWFIKRKGDEVRVQVEGFYLFLTNPARAQLFTLPGKVPAIRLYMRERMGGYTDVKDGREWVVLPYDKVIEPYDTPS